MRAVLLVVLLVSFSDEIHAQYYDFPFVGWKQTTQLSQGDYTGNFDKSIIQSEIIKDTLINGRNYFKQVNPFGSQFLRSEEGKLFRLASDLVAEELLMDFSLSVGDDIKVERVFVPGGTRTITLFVLGKQKILGPGKDSIFRITLTEDLNSPFGGETWIEGVGNSIGGLNFGSPINEMSSAFQLCTLNENNQTIYSSEFFDCGCDDLYGVDNDRDGFRNHAGGVRKDIIITANTSGENLELNVCDTLVIANLMDLPVEVLVDDEVRSPDFVSSGNVDSLYYSNLVSSEPILIYAIDITELAYTIQPSDCFFSTTCSVDDCDDNDATINAGQEELPYNGIDDDCDPSTLDDDLDQDGFILADDCNDNDATINSGQMEIPYNGIDDDCNPSTLDDDLDQDGFALTDDCDDNNSNINPSQNEVPYNGIDDDCNPATLDDDLDQDGFLVTEDCDDNNSDIRPDAQEICNKIDYNCNGQTDEGLELATYFFDNDGDGFGDPNTFVTDCMQPSGYVLPSTDCDDTNPNIAPDQNEIRYNDLDDDCNSVTLDDDLDQDGFVLADDCDDNNSSINPGAEEIPNNDIDENCDGMDLISATHELSNATVSIFPNPAANFIRIDLVGQLDYQCALYNMEGKLIKAETNNQVLQISEIASGSYLLEIKDLKSSSRIIERLVIIR